MKEVQGMQLIPIISRDVICTHLRCIYCGGDSKISDWIEGRCPSCSGPEGEAKEIDTTDWNDISGVDSSGLMESQDLGVTKWGKYDELNICCDPFSRGIASYKYFKDDQCVDQFRSRLKDIDSVHFRPSQCNYDRYEIEIAGKIENISLSPMGTGLGVKVNGNGMVTVVGKGELIKATKQFKCMFCLTYSSEECWVKDNRCPKCGAGLC